MKADECWTLTLMGLKDWETQFPSSAQQAQDGLEEMLKKEAREGGSYINWDSRILSDLPGLSYEYSQVRHTLVETLLATLVLNGFKVKIIHEHVYCISWGQIDW